MSYRIKKPIMLHIIPNQQGMVVYDVKDLTFGTGDTLEVALVDYARSLIATRDILKADESRLADTLQHKLDMLRALIEDVGPVGDWQRAKGALDLDDEMPEDIVRRMRDGAPAVCGWEWVRGGVTWKTGCGRTWHFSGTPKDKGYVFCPYCGGKIEVRDDNK